MKIAAPAKINLALHVTGQRADGYHLLESLVAFADVGDVILIEASDQDRLTFSGPFGRFLAANFGSNLILKALGALREHAHERRCPPVAIHLEKNLPIASGIGGGSADAAAALKGLNEHWGLGFDVSELARIGLMLGADVPMCLHGQPLIAKGIGDVIELVELPSLHMLLVNPGVAVSTPAVFKLLVRKDNEKLQVIPPLVGGRRRARSVARPVTSAMPTEGGNRAHAPQVSLNTMAQLISYLQTTRNDLQSPAVTLEPIIADVVSALQTSGALFARMSGSGATCFGLYNSPETKAAARATLSNAHPDWWIA